MLTQPFIALAAAAILALMTSCAGPQPIAVEDRYVEPTAGPEVGEVFGSRQTMNLGDYTAYVYAVDEKRLIAPRENWSRPLRVFPGSRQIKVVMKRRGFVAFLNFAVLIEAGKEYEVRFEGKVSPLSGAGYCAVWICDRATGRMVSDLQMPESEGGKMPDGWVPPFLLSH